MPTREGYLPTLDQLVAGGTKNTASDSGVWHNFGPAKSLRIHIIVSARSGTSPAQNIYLEDSMDGVNWANVVTANLTGAAPAAVPGVVPVNVEAPFGDMLRLRWDAPTGTTPSFSWSAMSLAQGN